MVKDVYLLLSYPELASHMFLGVTGSLKMGVATYGPREVLRCAILEATSELF